MQRFGFLETSIQSENSTTGGLKHYTKEATPVMGCINSVTDKNAKARSRQIDEQVSGQVLIFKINYELRNR